MENKFGKIEVIGDFSDLLKVLSKFDNSLRNGNILISNLICLLLKSKFIFLKNKLSVSISNLSESFTKILMLSVESSNFLPSSLKFINKCIVLSLV